MDYRSPRSSCCGRLMKKEFACVAMKWRIQAEHRREAEELEEEEAARRQMRAGIG